MSRRFAGGAAAQITPSGNDMTLRAVMWKRFAGNDWAAFESLPPAIRRRMHEHAYDAWTVNALIMWRTFRRQLASSTRAERRMLRYLDECEALERDAFAGAYKAATGLPLPHLAAGVPVLRYHGTPCGSSGPGQSHPGCTVSAPP
jgi:hypothetical protein